jgi:hypothetical protein
MGPNVESSGPTASAKSAAVAASSRITVANAFSLQMLNSVQDSESVEVRFTKLSLEEAETLVRGARELVSAIGHQDTATILSRELGVSLPQNRISVELAPGTTVVVAQVVGGRLPEGATELPSGATIQYWKVQLKDPVSRSGESARSASCHVPAVEQFLAGTIDGPAKLPRL